MWGESNAALQAGSAMLGSLARLEMMCRRMVIVVSTGPDVDKAKIKKLRQRGKRASCRRPHRSHRGRPPPVYFGMVA